MIKPTSPVLEGEFLTIGPLPKSQNEVLVAVTKVFLPEKSHGWRSLVGYSPWGCKEADMTEWLTHAPNAEDLGLLAAYLLSFSPVVLCSSEDRGGCSEQGEAAPFSPSSHPSVP